MISLIIGIMVSLVVTIVGTPLLIKLVHKLNYGQYIRQDGPKSHLVKRGTPTLGGVVINLAVVLGWCSSALYRFYTRGEEPSWSAVLVLFAMLFMRCYKIIMGQSDLRDRFSAFGVTLVLAIGAGSVFFSHLNDAGFWLVKEYFGMSVGQTLKTWSLMETILSVVGLGCVMLLSLVL